MLLYPAAMSDPDRNPNFRRLWTEPILSPKRKRRAEGGSDTPLHEHVEQAHPIALLTFLPSRRPAPVNGPLRATLAERGIVVQRKSDWSRRLRPARFSDASVPPEAPDLNQLTERRATEFAR